MEDFEVGEGLDAAEGGEFVVVEVELGEGEEGGRDVVEGGEGFVAQGEGAEL